MDERDHGPTETAICALRQPHRRQAKSATPAWCSAFSVAFVFNDLEVNGNYIPRKWNAFRPKWKLIGWLISFKPVRPTNKCPLGKIKYLFLLYFES